jgi:hypothetical protein
MTWIRARYAKPFLARPFKLAVLPVSLIIRGCPFPRLAILWALLSLSTIFASKFYWSWMLLTVFAAGSRVSLPDAARLHLYGASYRRLMLFNFKLFILTSALPLLAVLSMPGFHNRTYYSVVVLSGLLLLRGGWTTVSNPQHDIRRRVFIGLSVFSAGLLFIVRDIGAQTPYWCYWILVAIGALCLWRRLEYWTEERLLEFAAGNSDSRLNRILRF